REDRFSDRPGDADRGIVPGDHQLVARSIEVGHLVLDLGGLREDAEAVHEAGRHVKLAKVGPREERRHPAPERGGAAPHVDRDVEDLAGDREDELALRLEALGMEATESAVYALRAVVLNEGLTDAALLVLPLVVGLKEEATSIA